MYKERLKKIEPLQKQHEILKAKFLAEKEREKTVQKIL